MIDGGTKDVPVPSRGLAKVDYRVRVLDVDSAKVLGKALTDVESDAMELTLPVEPFGVKLAVSNSGSIAAANGNTTQSVAFPAGIESNTRKLTITLTPSIAGTVFGALDYLTSYPYGCTEQTMSSFLPDVLVSDALKKLGVKSNVDPAVLNKQVQAGLDRLYNYHHPDGGWGWWQTDDSTAFMTAYVLAGLTQAKAAGYDVKARHDRQRPRVAAERVRQDAERAHRSARLHGVRAGAERNGFECDGARFRLEPALDTHRLRAGAAGTGHAAGGRLARQRSGEAA